ncbi:MAG: polyphosphate polymerase domain-containing protein [Balneolaceae bacterium]|nr:polyphosphate polymerase domain-containing protein [Balneolaceae bacterium]
MEDKIQRQRFELKYRISESKALQIRQFVQTYLDCDIYGQTQPNLSYRVNSLYLDSSNLKTYQDTINGDRNRFKLRLRYYDEKEGPINFEIKRRYNKVIRKQRAKVKREFLNDLLNGSVPTYNHLVYKNPEQLQSLSNFIYLQNLLGALPKIHVTYLREAYEMHDNNSARVTFDRSVQSSSRFNIENGLSARHDNPVSVFGNTVILELKFTDRFPHWMEELIQVFHLRQQSAAKYVDGIIKIKNRKLTTV